MSENGSLKDLKNYTFFPLHFRDTSFSIAGQFSKVQLDFATIKSNEAAYEFPVWKVFRQPTEEEFQNFKSIVFKDYNVLDDKDSSCGSTVLQHTLKNFLSLIVSNICINKLDEEKYPPSLFNEKVTSALLGMGEALTWHGYPDARLRTQYCEVDIVCHNSDTKEEPEETSIYDFQVKTSSILKVHSSQLISTAIVSSFVEHSIHSDLNPAVPTILIDQFTFCICIYDSVSDILLISDVITFKKGTKVQKDTAYLLWLVCHHREFLHHPNPAENYYYKSGFHDLAEYHQRLKKYKSLKSKNSSWKSMPSIGLVLERGPFVEGSFSVLDKPGKKRKVYEN